MAAAETSDETKERFRAKVIGFLRDHWQLLVCGLVGAVLLAVASYILVRDGGSTPLTALIVTGGLLVFLGTFGHRITMIRFKELEIRLLEAAADALAEGNEKGAELLEAAAAEIATEHSMASSPADAETEALAKLEGNLPDGVRLFGEFSVGRFSIDGRLIRDADGAEYWVEVVIGTPVVNRATRKLVPALQAADPKPLGVVLITDATGPRLTSILEKRFGVPVRLLKRTGPGYQYKDFIRRFLGDPVPVVNQPEGRV